jgi:hypothetical protein
LAERSGRGGQPRGGAIAVAAAVLLSLLAVRLHSAGQPASDDAYITYRYADNLAKGYGFVFNRGAAPVLGTSTPLYTGLLAAGGAFGADVPTLGLVLGAIALSVALGLAVLLARDLGAPAAGLAAAVTWNATPHAWASLAGMETPLYLALVLGALWAAQRGRPRAALLVAALAVLTRLDGVAVLAAVVALLVLSRRWSWRAAVPAAALLAAWSALAVYWFGSPVPASGLAKLVHEDGISGRFDPVSPALLHLAFPAGQLLLAKARGLSPSVAALAVCAVVACAVALRKSLAAAALLLWLALYTAGFRLLGLPDFPWYYSPIALVATLLIWATVEWALAAGCRFAAARSTGWLARRMTLAAPAAVLALAAGAAVLAAAPAREGAPAQDRPAQQAAGKWLRRYAPADATVAAYETGKIAYFSGLHVVDILGLTEPRARPFVRRGDYAWAVRELPTYVFSNENAGWVVADALFRSCAFALAYRPAARFPFRPGLDYVLYRRADDQPAAAAEGGGPAHWIDAYVPPAVPRSGVGAYSVMVRNASDAAWVPGGEAAVAIGYHWLGPDDAPVVRDGERTPVPCRVEPGQSVLVSARVRAPADPGAYLLQWDAAHATRGWLGDSGAAATPAPVTVR